MKKTVAILLMAVMLFSLAACSQGSGSKAAEYKLGMGIVLSMDSSTTKNAQVDATVATVVTDAAGKIVLCRLDVAQNKMDVTDGQVDTAKTFRTKAELKEEYNMVKFSDATLEWYQQAQGFETYVVGKTAAEVQSTDLRENGEHMVAVDETLYASCSIDITDFIDAVVKACNDEQGQTFTASGDFTLGVAAISTADESTAATADKDGVVKMYSAFGAAVVQDGKILAALNDATQPNITVDANGEIVDTDFTATKRELKEDYNMVKYRPDATAEWYVQSKAFSDWAAGKTAAELRGTETTTNDEGYQVAVDEALHASVTISIQDMVEVIARAVDYAR